MITVTANSASALWRDTVDAVLVHGAPSCPRGLDTWEATDAHLTLTRPRRRLVCVPPDRVINAAFAAAETVWILAGLDDAWIYTMRLFPLRVLSRSWPRTTPVFAAETCPPRHPDDPVEQIHADVAAALQERIEQVMVHLARRAQALTGASMLMVGGGVAMNCVAIGRICRQAGFERVAVPLSPGDAGTSAGAALAVYRNLTGQLPDGVAGFCYLGPATPTFNCRCTHARGRPLSGFGAPQDSSPSNWPKDRSSECSADGWRPGPARWATGRSWPPRCSPASWSVSTTA
ncbi:carbamoyltransferase N-terminal domain-containing protein [Actinomadura sp. NPDC023710]|uniref:carbamoyltransferase N-terminal domain-containing protein n=1 Tax=Actinomadura sp. NPDC023710 TaxID=3158219 RepID=UPI0033E23DB7